MSHPTTVRFDEGEFRRLRRMADERGTTVSDLIREAVRHAYFDESRGDNVDELMAFIRDNPAPTPESVDEIDEKIDRAMRDAADRQ